MAPMLTAALLRSLPRRFLGGASPLIPILGMSASATAYASAAGIAHPSASTSGEAPTPQPLFLPLLKSFSSSPVSKEDKDEFKEPPWPEMGSATQEGAGAKRAAAEEAGYERAREGGERLRKADSFEEALREGTNLVSDAAKGVGEFAAKVADMGREAVGRSVETARGLGVAGPGKGGSERSQGLPQQEASSEGRITGTASTGAGGSAGGTKVAGSVGAAAEELSKPVTPADLKDKADTRAGSYSGSE